MNAVNILCSENVIFPCLESEHETKWGSFSTWHTWYVVAKVKGEGDHIWFLDDDSKLGLLPFHNASTHIIPQFVDNKQTPNYLRATQDCCLCLQSNACCLIVQRCTCVSFLSPALGVIMVKGRRKRNLYLPGRWFSSSAS